MSLKQMAREYATEWNSKEIVEKEAFLSILMRAIRDSYIAGADALLEYARRKAFDAYESKIGDYATTAAVNEEKFVKLSDLVDWVEGEEK